MDYPFRQQLETEQEENFHAPPTGRQQSDVDEEQNLIREYIEKHARLCGNNSYRIRLPVLNNNSILDVILGILERGWNESPQFVNRSVRGLPIYMAVLSVYFETNGYYLCPEELFDFIVNFVSTWGNSPSAPNDNDIITIRKVYYDRYLSADLGASSTDGTTRTRSISPDAHNKRHIVTRRKAP